MSPFINKISNYSESPSIIFSVIIILIKFFFNNGISIIITIPSILMTCNGGAPDGDIAYLIANNIVTIFDPLGNQLYP